MYMWDVLYICDDDDDGIGRGFILQGSVGGVGNKDCKNLATVSK